MVVYVNGIEYDLFSNNLFNNIIGAGEEGTVFRVGDKAIKVYTNFLCNKVRLGLNAVDILKEIPTKRVLMPKEKVFNSNGYFCGYTTDYIEEINLDINRFTMRDYISELKNYEDDMDILSRRHIEAKDMTYNNIVFSNYGIFMIDPGSFQLGELDYNFIKNNNDEELRRLFIQILSFGLQTIKEYECLHNFLNTNGKFSETIEHYLDNENETITSYSLKLINRR